VLGSFYTRNIFQHSRWPPTETSTARLSRLRRNVGRRRRTITSSLLLARWYACPTRCQILIRGSARNGERSKRIWKPLPLRSNVSAMICRLASRASLWMPQVSPGEPRVKRKLLCKPTLSNTAAGRNRTFAAIYVVPFLDPFHVPSTSSAKSSRTLLRAAANAFLPVGVARYSLRSGLPSRTI
jgi:hypothetical protein